MEDEKRTCPKCHAPCGSREYYAHLCWCVGSGLIGLSPDIVTDIYEPPEMSAGKAACNRCGYVATSSEDLYGTHFPRCDNQVSVTGHARRAPDVK